MPALAHTLSLGAVPHAPPAPQPLLCANTTVLCSRTDLFCNATTYLP